MIIGKTSKGFEYQIPKEKINNMELVDCLAEIDENPLAFSKLINLMFEKEEKKKLYDFFRTENGLVPTELIEEAIVEIFKEGKIKN